MSICPEFVKNTMQYRLGSWIRFSKDWGAVLCTLVRLISTIIGSVCFIFGLCDGNMAVQGQLGLSIVVFYMRTISRLTTSFHLMACLSWTGSPSENL